jgi:hypothetical protein
MKIKRTHERQLSHRDLVAELFGGPRNLADEDPYLED